MQRTYWYQDLERRQIFRCINIFMTIGKPLFKKIILKLKSYYFAINLFNTMFFNLLNVLVNKNKFEAHTFIYLSCRFCLKLWIFLWKLGVFLKKFLNSLNSIWKVFKLCSICSSWLFNLCSKIFSLYVKPFFLGNQWSLFT